MATERMSASVNNIFYFFSRFYEKYTKTTNYTYAYLNTGIVVVPIELEELTKLVKLEELDELGILVLDEL